VDVASISPADSLSYHGVDFGPTAPARIIVPMASSAGRSGTLQFRLDSTTGPVIAALPVDDTGGWQSWQEHSAAVTTAVTGNRSVHLTFAGSWGQDLLNLDWLRFSR
jgi:hypothetical protein